MNKKSSIAMQTISDSRQKVILMHASGASMSAIARELGVSAPSVQKWLKREGFLYGKKGRYHEKMPENAKKLVRRGYSRAQIAKAFRCPLKAVEEWTSGEVADSPGGSKKRSKSSKVHSCRKHWTAEEKNIVLGLIQRGFSPQKIYLHTRASKQRQRKIWREAGFTGRPTNFKRPVRFPVRGSALGVIGFRSALPEMEFQRKRPRVPAQRTPPGQFVEIPPQRRGELPAPSPPRPEGLVPDYQPQRTTRRMLDEALPRVTQISPPDEKSED